MPATSLSSFAAAAEKFDLTDLRFLTYGESAGQAMKMNRLPRDLSSMVHVTRCAFRFLIAAAALCIGPGKAIGHEKIELPIGVGTKTVGTHIFWLAAKTGFFL